MSDKYRVDLVYRGLFLLWRDATGVTVYLPYGRGPHPCEVDPGRALREHVCGIELPAAAVWNRQDFADFTVGVQPAGAASRPFLRLAGRNHRAEIATAGVGVPDWFLGRAHETHGQVRAVADSSADSVKQLIAFQDQPAANPVTSAVFRFETGFVTSERCSLRRREDGTLVEAEWVELPIPDIRAAIEQGTLGALLTGNLPQARKLNLDLRVSLSVPIASSFAISFGGPTLEIEPVASPVGGPHPDIELIVHNQEFPAVFAPGTESADDDLPTDLDVDQEYFRDLAEQGVQQLTMPVSTHLGEQAPQGQACGGSEGDG